MLAAVAAAVESLPSLLSQVSSPYEKLPPTHEIYACGRGLLVAPMNAPYFLKWR